MAIDTNGELSRRLCDMSLQSTKTWLVVYGQGFSKRRYGHLPAAEDAFLRAQGHMALKTSSKVGLLN